MDTEIAAALAQFGTAGLVGWMWLTERRTAGERDRHLAEAHDKLIQERRSLDLLLAAMQDSTRVLTTIEVGQRQLAGVLDRLAAGLPAHEPASGAHAAQSATLSLP